METQHHRNPKQSGHEGHGGIHVCHKCGWPFPNSHPSARHRRAHKRVCGTIEGYRLELGNAEEKAHLDGSDGEHVSDDEHKNSSGKVVEKTISRRSSSGVGSRSSRSNRSEDEVFADAVMDFTESPGPEDSSDGVIQRFYSLQNITENDPDDNKHVAENPIGDNLCTPTCEDNQLQTVQKLEFENDEVEASVLSQNHVSSPTIDPALVSASVTSRNENEVEHDMKQSCKTSTKLDVAEEGNEIVSSKDQSELRSSYGESAEGASEDVSGLSGASKEVLDSVSADGMTKSTGAESTGFEKNIECSQELDSPENFCSSVLPVQVMDPANEDASKSSDMIGAIGNAYVLAVPDGIPLQEHPEIAIEELDHKGGKLNISKAMDSTLAKESMEYSKAHATEEVCCTIDLSRTGDSTKVCPEDDVLKNMEGMLKQEVGQNSTAEQRTIGEPDQIPDVKASDADSSEIKSEVVVQDFKSESLEDKKLSSTEQNKSILSLENVVSEGSTVYGGENQETSSNGGSNTINSVKDDSEHLVVNENDCSELSVEELAVRSASLFTEPATDDIPSQVSEAINAHEVQGIVSNESEMSSGGTEENKAVNPETAHYCGSTLAVSHDSILEPLEPEKNYDLGKSDKMLDSGHVMAGDSQTDSLLIAQGVREIESTGGNLGGGESVNDCPVTALKTDDHPGLTSMMNQSGVSEVCGDAGSSIRSSAVVNDSCTKRSAEDPSGVVEGDGTPNPHSAVSTIDVLPDSGSQTDSLEGNWGSVSDTLPATDTPASNHSQASAGEESMSLEPKPVAANQHTDIKTSVKPQLRIQQTEGASEIQASEEQQQQKTSVGHADNKPHGGGKKNEEIITKHHTALKTLLGEATARSRAESPIHKQASTTPVPKKDETPVTNNGLSAKAENVTLNPESEASKEWNSPARYPVNIKTEKRRAKSRPYWAPFLCCSSVNAR